MLRPAHYNACDCSMYLEFDIHMYLDAFFTYKTVR
jgi:hypothetical protein